MYAVRAGPVLLHNLVAQAHGTPLQVYEPQPDFLKLLCTGDGNAIGRWAVCEPGSLFALLTWKAWSGAKFGLAFYGTWVWKLKDWIDSSFMRLFRPELLPSVRAWCQEAAGRHTLFASSFGGMSCALTG